MIQGLRGASIWSEDVKNLLPFYRDVLGLKVGFESPGFVRTSCRTGCRHCWSCGTGGMGRAGWSRSRDRTLHPKEIRSGSSDTSCSGPPGSGGDASLAHWARQASPEGLAAVPRRHEAGNAGAASVVYQSRSIDARGDGGIGWDLMKQIPLTLWRWTRAEYDRLVDLGVLHGNRWSWSGASSSSPIPRAATTPARLAPPAMRCGRSCRKGGRCESRCRWPSTTSPSRSQTWPW